MHVTNGNSSSMSDNSDNSDDLKAGENMDDICRDFLRNVCKRGRRCRYRHPECAEPRDFGRRQEFTFCHDYQNSGCRRASCKFIHCTREEEDYYKQTGQLPVRLQQATALGIGVIPTEAPLLKGEVPVCKDFLKGECKRAGRCKYRHIGSPVQYDLEVNHSHGDWPKHVPAYDSPFVKSNDYDRCDYDYRHVVKRRRTDSIYENNENFHLRTPIDYIFLEEENAMLRRKVEELKKQVSDLAATNEVLLEQNARYRASKANVVAAAPPIVTVSQVVTPTITPSPAVARAVIRTLNQQALNQLSTSLPQTLTVNANSEMLVSHNALQPPRLCADLSGQATLAAAPATLDTPVSVSMTPQTIVPVSITMDTSVGPPGTLATVSMAQPNLQPPNVSLSQTSLSTQSLISAHSTRLVSYPVMSHPLPNSSLG